MRRLPLVELCLLILVSVIVADSGQAFSLEEAASIYRSRFGQTPPSVQEEGDYLFVILEGNLDNDTDECWNRVILKGQLDALSAYVGRSARKSISPFSPAVTTQLEQIAGFEVPDARMVKVDELRYHGRFRHVSAFEAGPFRKARDDVRTNAPIVRTVDEWGKLIDLKLSALNSERERVSFWSSLGATIPSMSVLGGLAVRLVGVDGPSVDRLYETWKGEEDEQTCYRALSVMPSFVRAHDRLAVLNERAGRFRHALSRKLKTSVSVPRPEEVMRLAREMSRTSGDDAWLEYGKLYGETLAHSEIFKGASGVFWQYELNTFGSIDYSAPSTVNDQAEGQFRLAKTLYAQGQDLPRIVSLLMKSIAVDPAVAEKWRYLGAALRTFDKPYDAVLAYHQTLLLDRDDGTAVADLCLLYERLGASRLARGNAWYCLVRFPGARQRSKLVSDVLK